MFVTGVQTCALPICKITTVTENLPTATKAKYTSPVFVGKPFKYLRVQVDKTSVGNSFAFAEFWMSTD